MAAKTPAPTGLSINRNGRTFGFSWKKNSSANNYNNGQGFKWWNGISTANVKIKASTTSVSQSIKLSDFFPYTSRILSKISFSVRGNQGKNGKHKDLAWSNWSSKEFANYAPYAPSASCGLTSDSVDNQSTFSWSTPVSDTDHRIFARNYVETLLVADNSSHGQYLGGWSYLTTSDASGSYTYEEDTNVIYPADGKSYTRWYRVKAQGPGGNSGWAYGYNVYAFPNKPYITEASGSKDKVATNTMQCTVRWTLAVQTYCRPVDEETVQYCLVSPDAGFTLPDGSTWTNGPTIKDYWARGSGSSTFLIDAPLLANQCLFARVLGSHNGKPTPSDSKVVKGLPYYLSNASITSIDPNDTTYRIAFTATNPSFDSIPDSRLAVVYRGSDQANEQIVGIFEGDSISATVQCPNWSGDEDFSIGVFAFADDEHPTDLYESYYVALPQPTVETWNNGVGWYLKDPYNEIYVEQVDHREHRYISEVTYTEMEVEVGSAKPVTSEYTSYVNLDTHTSLLEDGQEFTIEPIIEVFWTSDGRSYRPERKEVRASLGHRSFKKGTAKELTAPFTWQKQSGSVRKFFGEINYQYTSDNKIRLNISYTQNGIDAQKYDLKIRCGVRVVSFTYRTDLDTTKEYYIQELLPVNQTKHTEAGVTYTTYDVPKDCLMKSEINWTAGNIPKAPKIQVLPLNSGSLQVTWNWAWNKANVAELSWSDHKDAWESTDEPSTYRVTDVHAARWNISGLEAGMEWYVRVRLIRSVDDVEIIGPWSDISSYRLTASPDIPTLSFDKYILQEGDSLTARWDYVSNDNTEQETIQICQATLNNDGTVTYGETLLSLDTTEKEYTFTAEVLENFGWVLGDSYYLCCRVKSSSGRYSDWSVPVRVNLVVPLEASITDISLEKRDSVYIHTSDEEIVQDKTYYTVTATEVVEPDELDITKYYELSDGVYVRTDDTEIEDGKTYYTIEATEVSSPDVSDIGNYYEASEGIYYLTEMPLTLTITGGGASSYTNVVIQRAENYNANRPDESTYKGFAGETVAYFSPQQGEGQITITKDNLVGNLDDTCSYILIATVYDELGQSVVLEVPFVVNWNIQAEKPSALVEIDNEQYIAKITPVLPDGRSTNLGDTCDIYRLSADKPQLIVENGSFGTTYVDPYPAIGEFGGHRIVLKTANGDYITSDGYYSWVDFGADDGDIFNSINSIIDTQDGRIEFLYNIDISNSWAKDFTETKYLGGSVQGDWNPAVSRTGTVNTVSVITQDQDTIRAFRKLANYAGICHIRTRDGSSFAADIQVSEDMKYMTYELATYNLSITKVDAQGLDGMTLAEWNNFSQ